MDTPWWLGYGGFLKWGYPPNHPSHFTIFVLKPMVLGISIPCIRMLPCIKVRILAADLKPPRLILGPDMGMAGCSVCRSFTYVYGGFLKWGTPKSCKSLLLINGKTNGFGFLCFRKPPYPYQHPSWNMAAMQWKTRVNICTVNKSNKYIDVYIYICVCDTYIYISFICKYVRVYYYVYIYANICKYM